VELNAFKVNLHQPIAQPLLHLHVRSQQLKPLLQINLFKAKFQLQHYQLLQVIQALLLVLIEAFDDENGLQ